MRPHQGRYPARIHAHFMNGGEPLTTTCICKMLGVELDVAHRIVRQMKVARCWAVEVRKDGRDHRGLPRQVIYNVTLKTNAQD